MFCRGRSNPQSLGKLRAVEGGAGLASERIAVVPAQFTADQGGDAAAIV